MLEQALNEFRPHIVLTYGGSWVSAQIHTRARRRGAKVVFALHNLAYRDARVFSNVDSVLVPSRYAGQWYRSNVGVICTAIPSTLNLSRVECMPDADQRYVTFVNPQPAKGVFVFARIAQELGRRRPDIPLLVVEGRGGVNWLARTGIDLSGLPNLSVMATTPDPRDFYRVSHLVLMPSVGHETFGRVAAESMANGIPVLASDRGALPEVVGDMGLLLKIPDRYTSQTRTAPSAREVEPWVQNIIRLWDDDELYACLSRQCQRAAQKWRAERLGPKYDTFFRQLAYETDPGLA